MALSFTENRQANIGLSLRTNDAITALRVSSNSKTVLSSVGLQEETQAAAEAGTSTGRYMSARRVKQAFDFQVDLSGYAKLISPTFTGTPLAPTASVGTNTTQIASTGFVKAAIDVVLGGVSSAFDTLSEIATDLGLKLVKGANLSDVANPATAFINIKQSATTSATGVVELATDAEVSTGTDTSRAIVAASLAQRAGFFVYKSANQTGVPHESYTLVTFDSERYDVGSCWNTSTSKWTPPAGRVWISGQIFVASGTKLAASATFLAKVIKNGAADVATGMGTFGTVSGVVSIGLPCMFDVANGTDTYELRVYLSAEGGGANTSTIDSNGAHTYLCGGIF